MKQKFMNSIPEEMQENYRAFGERFHKSFNVETGRPHNDICLEEALSYVVESIKSGLHPKYLTEDEKALLIAGYGEKWYTKWGYSDNDFSSP